MSRSPDSVTQECSGEGRTRRGEERCEDERREDEGSDVEQQATHSLFLLTTSPPRTLATHSVHACPFAPPNTAPEQHNVHMSKHFPRHASFPSLSTFPRVPLSIAPA